MNRKNLLLAAGCSLLILASCQSSNKDQIVRKWQVESFESPYMDSIRKAQEMSIDTISTLDSNMARMAGTNNLDSFKMMFKKQMQSQKEAMDEMYKQISMEFQQGGIMVQTGGGRTDSLKYTVADKKLMLSPLNPPAGVPSTTDTLEIEKLSATEMKLKIGKTGNQVAFINLKAASDKKAEEKK